MAPPAAVYLCCASSPGTMSDRSVFYFETKLILDAAVKTAVGIGRSGDGTELAPNPTRPVSLCLSPFSSEWR